MTRKALGRGIKALIPDVEAPETPEATLTLRVEEIRRGRHQPRNRFEPSRLEELANSIRQKGLLQPVLVRRVPDGYELVAGERRLRAAVQAGLAEIPAVVRDLTDEEAAEAAIIENIQREDLDPIEKALSFQRLMRDFGLSQEDISQRLGGDRSSIANFVRLLQLPAEIQGLVSAGQLSMGHARALITVPDAGRQLELARKAVAAEQSVRDLERGVREVLSRPARPKVRRASSPASTLTPDEQDLVNRAQRHLGTRVRLRRLGSGGEVTIEYYSASDLDRILRKMGVLVEKATPSYE